MNLFFKRLFGQMLSTEKFEKRIDDAAASLLRYHQVGNSQELKEFLLLREEVKSKDFLRKKQLYQKTKYKQTKEYAMLAELKKLNNHAALQLFLEVKDSNNLKDFLLFRHSPEYIKLSDRRLVKDSPDLKRMKDFEKSKAYKAYLAIKDTDLPKKYAELQRDTADEAFQQANLFWSNPNRWQTTEEYKNETRYTALLESPDIQFYLKQDRKKIQYYEQFTETFCDNFDWKRLSDSAWSAGFAYASKALKRHHSFINEQQANHEGKNTGTINGILTLVTKEETATSPAWDEHKGFINKTFAYTSDVITTAEQFRQKEGLFMAKVRCEGDINHVAWMGSDKKLPLVKLFHFTGKQLLVGHFTEKGFKGERIRGINVSDHYIYSIVWTRKELIWYVNNIEVHRSTSDVPREALYLAFSSYIAENQRPEEGKIESDWVRVYTKS